jgi:hypothetical protein
MCRNRLDANFADVAVWHQTEILAIKGSQGFVDLAGKDTLVAELSQCNVETAQTSK